MARNADPDLIAGNTMMRTIRELSAETQKTEEAEQIEGSLPNK